MLLEFQKQFVYGFFWMKLTQYENTTLLVKAFIPLGKNKFHFRN